MISVKIDVAKIDKQALYKGAKGTYLNVTLIPNKDGETDEYGNDFWVVQDLGAERRKAGEKGPKLGNARNIVLVNRENVTGERPTSFADKVKPAKAFQNRQQAEEEDDDLPF